MEYRRELVCTREMHFEEGPAGSGSVVLNLWRPERIIEETGDAPSFVCAFDILGLPDGPIRGSVRGYDGFQALALAYAGLRFNLMRQNADLRWTGLPLDEMPLVVAMQDAGRRRRVEDILAEEEYAVQYDLNLKRILTELENRES